MQSLAMQKTHFLIDEWKRLHMSLPRIHTQTVRIHVARMMLTIEKEIMARKEKAR